MAEDGKFSIEKFDGSDFSWWKMQMDALLCQKDLDMTNAKVGLADSRVKRVQFTAKNSETPGNQLEYIQRSEHRRDFRDSGSIESVRTQLGNQCWVQKTRKPNEISPGKLLLVGSVPPRIPVSDGSSLWESVGIEDEKTWSVMTGYWMTGLLCALDGGLDSIARPPSGRLLGLRRPLGD
ncbi:hypothetical protein E3N88_10446 [Mikania micrantha]|uniref:Uncharacterized protein n=1 Tax=Mikania micrantha TaxID=192012 RepID=A0A5N6PAP6_9ASTR|nr:hypothetical protein E3N88_10446 [Mikania micrantha]